MIKAPEYYSRSNSNVFTLGVWDGAHIGHIRLLQNAAKLGSFLIVGIVNDEAVKRVKGQDRPKHHQLDRLEITYSIKNVHDCFLINDFDPNILIDKYIQKYGIEDFNSANNIFVFGEDQSHLKELNNDSILKVYLKRTPDVSTSSLYFGGK